MPDVHVAALIGDFYHEPGPMRAALEAAVEGRGVTLDFFTDPLAMPWGGLATYAALIVARFREDVDADSWEEAVAGFRATMSTRLVRGLPPALAALAAMVVTDGAIVLVSLRLVGVDASSLLPTAIVLGSFFVAYPLTALPLAGLGVLDAALIVAYTETAGVAAEPEIVAALVVWRVVTLIGTLLLGALSFGWWRWRTGTGSLPPADVPAEDRT